VLASISRLSLAASVLAGLPSIGSQSAPDQATETVPSLRATEPRGRIPGRGDSCIGDASGRGFAGASGGAATRIESAIDTRGGRVAAAVDGVATNASWSAESNQAHAHFGFAVASAGDVNGDGFDDVIVGAPGYDNGRIGEGGAFVYLGSAGGLDTNAAWAVSGGQALASFGYSVAGAGDVDGDGFADVLVGAPRYDGGEIDEGRAYLFRGSSTGLGKTAAWTTESDLADAELGRSVASAGDVNGDGFADIIVGAPWYDGGSALEGRAWVYHGSPAGLSTSPDWTGNPNRSLAAFGSSVASAGDVNGDGFADVIVGAEFYENGEYEEGGAYAYLGSPSGLLPTAAWTAESDGINAHFGHSVCSAGDVDGDGFSDVLVGAYRYENRGRVFCYHGSASGLDRTEAWSRSPLWGHYFGYAVSTAGDVNGDGYSDVIIGDFGKHSIQGNEGTAEVYNGSPSGLRGFATWADNGDRVGMGLGWSVAGAGDVDGDGNSDVLMGAMDYSNGESQEGGAFGYYLSASTAPAVYCTSGPASNGCVARISGSGLPSATAVSGFTLQASKVKGAQYGFYFLGTHGRTANPWGNGSGFRCVAPPVARTGLLPGNGTPGTCEGILTQDLNAVWCPSCPRPALNPGAGALVQAQLWYLDLASTSNRPSSLSDAIEFLVAP